MQNITATVLKIPIVHCLNKILPFGAANFLPKSHKLFSRNLKAKDVEPSFELLGLSKKVPKHYRLLVLPLFVPRGVRYVLNLAIMSPSIFFKIL